MGLVYVGLLATSAMTEEVLAPTYEAIALFSPPSFFRAVEHRG